MKHPLHGNEVLNDRVTEEIMRFLRVSETGPCGRPLDPRFSEKIYTTRVPL